MFVAVRSRIPVPLESLQSTQEARLALSAQTLLATLTYSFVLSKRLERTLKQELIVDRELLGVLPLQRDSKANGGIQ